MCCVCLWGGGGGGVERLWKTLLHSSLGLEEEKWTPYLLPLTVFKNKKNKKILSIILFYQMKHFSVGQHKTICQFLHTFPGNGQTAIVEERWKQWKVKNNAVDFAGSFTCLATGWMSITDEHTCCFVHSQEESIYTENVHLFCCFLSIKNSWFFFCLLWVCLFSKHRKSTLFQNFLLFFLFF